MSDNETPITDAEMLDLLSKQNQTDAPDPEPTTEEEDQT